MQALLVATEGRLRRAWVAMVAHLREENSVERIAARLHTEDPVVGVGAAAALFAAGEHLAYVNAGQVTARWLDKQLRPAAVAKKLPVFDPLDSEAMRAAERNRLELIREIEAEQRMLVRDILMEGARTGANPRVVAREIRETIGLTEYQRGIVENYRRQLESGAYAQALERELSSGVSDRAIAAALRDTRALTPAQIDTAVERYRANMVTARAETIARTEGLRIAHQGSEELYRQAVERGDLEASQIERTWNHSPGAKNSKNERVFHRVMHGQVRGFGERFESGLGGQLRYPGDPEASGEETISCRCCLSTRVKAAQGAASGGAGMPRGGAAEEPGAAGSEAEMEVEGADEAAIDEEVDAADAAEQEGAGSEGDPVDQAEPVDDAALDEPSDVDLDVDDPELYGPPSPGYPPSPQPSGARQQQLQQAEQRLARRRAELEAAQEAHAAAEQEVAGFRIGVSSEIEGAEGITGAGAEAAAEAEAPIGRPPITVEPAPEELPNDPYRSPGAAKPRDTVLPSDAPAPLGYESIEYNDQLYYRQAITGRSYTPAQVAERQQPKYVIDLTGPGEVAYPGFQAVELKELNMSAGEVRYRGPSERALYTPEQMADGEAAATEKWLADLEAKEAHNRPGLWGRLKTALSGW
jgi:hypothetical protein